MAPNLSFRRVTEDDIAILATWFEDPDLSRWISAPDDIWREYILRDNGISKCWVCVDHEQRLLAEIQVDQENRSARGYIDIYLDPTKRGVGLGRRILREFLIGPGADYPGIEASIDPENSASLGCFRAVGFRDLPGQPEPKMLRLFWEPTF